MNMASAQLDPVKIARAFAGEMATGLRCPRRRCGATVVVERHGAGFQATCTDLDCGFRQLTEPPTEAPALASQRAQHKAGVAEAPAFRPKCRVETCGRLADEAGLCRTCFLMWKRAQRPPLDAWCVNQAAYLSRTQPTKAAAKKENTVAHKGCLVPNCDRKHAAKGLCQNHYYRWDTAGRPDRHQWAMDAPLVQGKASKPAAPSPETLEEPDAGEPVSGILIDGGNPDVMIGVPPPEPVEPSAPSVTAAAIKGPIELRTIQQPRPVQRLQIGFIGDYFSILDDRGAVLTQFDVGGEDA